MLTKCKYCGEYFENNGLFRVTCGKEQCKREYWKDHTKAYRAKLKERELRKKLKKDALLRDAIEAKKLGVSYGNYIAFYKNKEGAV